jgi:hypothetical protein
LIVVPFEHRFDGPVLHQILSLFGCSHVGCAGNTLAGEGKEKHLAH